MDKLSLRQIDGIREQSLRIRRKARQLVKDFDRLLYRLQLLNANHEKFVKKSRTNRIVRQYEKREGPS